MTSLAAVENLRVESVAVFKGSGGVRSWPHHCGVNCHDLLSICRLVHMSSYFQRVVTQVIISKRGQRMGLD
jgi:hypothetical protein